MFEEKRYFKVQDGEKPVEFETLYSHNHFTKKNEIYDLKSYSLNYGHNSCHGTSSKRSRDFTWSVGGHIVEDQDNWQYC